MIRVGINGLGRIGRAIFRVNALAKHFKVVVINDINPDPGNIAYTLNYDTLYGRLDPPLKLEHELLYDKDQNSIHICHETHIDHVDWAKYDVDYVIDASGVAENVSRARNLTDKNTPKSAFGMKKQ